MHHLGLKMACHLLSSDGFKNKNKNKQELKLKVSWYDAQITHIFGANYQVTFREVAVYMYLISCTVNAKYLHVFLPVCFLFIRSNHDHF